MPSDNLAWRDPVVPARGGRRVVNLPTAAQTGGSADLDALWAELRAGWPAYHVTEIYRGKCYSSGPDMRQETHVQTLDGWCVEVVSDGYESERDRWFEWGRSIADAAGKLAAEMLAARTDEHTAALGLEHYHEIRRDSSIFRAACPACVKEAEWCEMEATA